MSRKEIIGPFFFADGTVNKDNYPDMLENYFYRIIKRRRLDKSITFQQDGAPVHFYKQACAWLDEKFDGRWIGKGGPISWAPRSPDLTPFDFFCGLSETIVYKTPVHDINDLKERISKKIASMKKKRWIMYSLVLSGAFNYALKLLVIDLSSISEVLFSIKTRKNPLSNKKHSSGFVEKWLRYSILLLVDDLSDTL